MSKNYKITRVSDKEPRTWSFTDKRTGQKVDMESYRVMLEGESDPIEINRKPGDKPTVGELLTGAVEESEYGKRFKPERKPFTPSTKDNSEIRAEWAIGQAVNWLNGRTDATFDEVETMGKALFAMVDRVKTGVSSPVTSLKEKFNEYRASKATAADENIPVVKDSVYDFDDEEKINLDDIPF